MSDANERFETAKTYIPGGVNSPVRAFNGVGGTPLFISKGEGAYIIDADGNRYIDYVGSWGPLILGHAHPKVIDAVIDAAKRGLTFGAPTEVETQLSQKVCELMPSIEQIRMVSSGTEATMSAIRLARGYTQREKIIKFEGCYHGHNDALLVKAGSGLLTLGKPSSAGVPDSFTEHTLVAEYNNLDSVAQLAEQHELAAIIVEPVAGNMNCIPPSKSFLQGLRDICDQTGAVLIFDEVMTGFRIALGGAQAHYGITPDLTTLGKIIGGGMPVGAFGGRKDIMKELAPQGPVYQAGTLSGNPIAMSAGLATLNELSQAGVYEQLATSTQQLMQGFEERARAANIPLVTHQMGSMFGLFFTEADDVTSYQAVLACDVERYKHFFHSMKDQGVYFAPSAFEAGFLSVKHGKTEIEKTLEAAEKCFAMQTVNG